MGAAASLWVAGGWVEGKLTASSRYVLLCLFLIRLTAVVFRSAAAASVGAFLILVAGVSAEAQRSHATMFSFHRCSRIAVLLVEGKGARLVSK